MPISCSVQVLGAIKKMYFFCFVGICFIFDNNISVNTFLLLKIQYFFYFAQGAYLYSLLVTSRSIFTLDMVFSRCQFGKLPFQRGTIYRLLYLSHTHGYVISSVDMVKVLSTCAITTKPGSLKIYVLMKDAVASRNRGSFSTANGLGNNMLW